MHEQDPLESAIKNLIIDLCGVLYKYGYQEISVGTLMRVIGINDERAARHDLEVIDLQSQFENHEHKHINQNVPPGTTFH